MRDFTMVAFLRQINKFGELFGEMRTSTRRTLQGKEFFFFFFGKSIGQSWVSHNLHLFFLELLVNTHAPKCISINRGLRGRRTVWNELGMAKYHLNETLLTLDFKALKFNVLIKSIFIVIQFDN